MNAPQKQPLKPPAGLKKQIFGSTLIAIGVFNVIAATTLKYELDVFYLILIVCGILFLSHGSRQR